MAKCDDDTNMKKQKEARARGYTADFAKVIVWIEKIDGDAVHFVPKGQTESIATQWTDPNVWPHCPTEVDLEEGAEGIAMIGCVYYKLSDAAKAKAGKRKWPEAEVLDTRKRAEVDRRELERPDPRARWGYGEGRISITRLRVEGRIVGQPGVTTHELIGSGLPSEFDLDASGFFSLVTIADGGPPREVKMQVLRAFVTGAGEIEATADVLDPMLGHPDQIVRVRGASASVILSQKGCAQFGVAFDP